MNTQTVKVSSPEFNHEELIPQKYTCEGAGINPPLQIDNLPDGTKSLALILEDPDTDHGMFVHWVAWNIEPGKKIKENSPPGTEGFNGHGQSGYLPPCPPDGSHRYYFRAYALDAMLQLPQTTGKDALLAALKPHLLGEGFLMARYAKQGQSA